MIDLIARFSILLMGAFTVSTFFGGLTENIYIAGSSALIAIIVGLIVAFVYKRKKGRPIIE